MTTVAKENNAPRGRVKGEPMRFIRGHSTGRPALENPDIHLPEDCGYETPCWVWRGTITKDGYGQLVIDGRATRAHRFIFERHRGAIPEGLVIDHLCRNHACVNPDHLEAVTPAVNTRRAITTKLTESDVAAIRASSDSHESAAERFGVSASHICGIRAGKFWRAAA